MAPRRSGDGEDEARRILARVAREADAGTMPRPDPEEEDWAEHWGRRIGALLGPALLVLVAAWFLHHLYGAV